MSNQIGDRYTCSDPNCGCEIEVKHPCNMTDVTGDSEEVEEPELRASSAIEEVSLDEPREELGTESGTALAEVEEEEAMTLTCFCGNEMRQTGSSAQRPRSAGASAD